MKILLTILSLLALWTVAALAILLPVLGVAWAADAWTDLTFGEASLLMMGSTIILIYLVQNYFPSGGLDAWMFSVGASVGAFLIAILEGLLIRRLTGMTLFHSTGIAFAAMLQLAYMFAHTSTGHLPPFLRSIAVDIMEDELEDDEVFVPPPRPRRKGRKPARPTRGK